MFLGEFKRWLRSPFILLIILTSIGTNILATYGIIQPAMGTSITLGAQQRLSDTASSMLFGGALFTAIIGIIVTTIDIKTGYYRYLSLRHSGFWHNAMVKAGVAAILAVPAVFLNVLCVCGTARMLMESGGMAYTAPDSPMNWILQYACLYSVSAIWGVAVGLIIRSSIIAIALQFIYATILESPIISSFPKVGRWLFGGAESAIVNDISLENRLDGWSGLGVALVWVGLLFLVAHANEWRRARSIVNIQQLLRLLPQGLTLNAD